MKEESWTSVINTNLKGTFLCTQQALKHMIKQKKSYIINLASIVGIYGNVGQANYAASKAGIIAFTRTVAKEYASKNILVNTIAPGCINTDMLNTLPIDIKNKLISKISLKDLVAQKMLPI